ncbi:MAG: hypothetical protein P1P76_02455 [Anaerolineales bacterium]|nr:hypothetical protein [Anaerolineales bacterium]
MDITDGRISGKLEWKKGPNEPLETTPKEHAVIEFLEAEQKAGIVRFWPEWDPPQSGPGRPRDKWYEWGAKQVVYGDRDLNAVVEDIFRNKPGAQFYEDPKKTIRKGVKRAINRLDQ